jgi:hypothetical protein
MFVQIMEGRVQDPVRMKELMERWIAELAPGAEGFLGATAGVAADGRVINIARFESAPAAKANSDRPEQGAWWSEMESCFDGEVSFAESEDVSTFLAGGSNDAGFVQVMMSTEVDRDLVGRMDRVFEGHAATLRPDVIGGLRVWTGPRSAYDITYFTSEQDARAGEKKDMPAEFGPLMEEFQALMASTDFLDLPDPWLY